MKLPAFQFYPGDWQKDPSLRRCSKAAKGVWIDMLCLMFECPIRGVLADAGGNPWSDQEIAEAVGGPIGSNLECIAELLSKGVASRDTRGAIFSRRLVRDEEIRQTTKDRVQKHRSNAVVTQYVTPVKRPCTEDENEVEDEGSIKSSIKRLFSLYCQLLRRDPDRYVLTKKRGEKAQMRIIERLKSHNGNLEAVEAEVGQAIRNLAESEWHVTEGHIDWIEQIFRSEEEYSKRLNWKKPAGSNGNGKSQTNSTGSPKNTGAYRNPERPEGTPEFSFRVPGVPK